jgi:hypothetical protein
MVKNRFNSIICKYLKATNKKNSCDNVKLEELEVWLNNPNEK